MESAKPGLGYGPGCGGKGAPLGDRLGFAPGFQGCTTRELPQSTKEALGWRGIVPKPTKVMATPTNPGALGAGGQLSGPVSAIVASAPGATTSSTGGAFGSPVKPAGDDWLEGVPSEKIASPVIPVARLLKLQGSLLVFWTVRLFARVSAKTPK